MIFSVIIAAYNSEKWIEESINSLINQDLGFQDTIEIIIIDDNSTDNTRLICEELIFRGWLYGKLRAKIPAFPAIVLVSLLFALVHGQWNVGVIVFAMSVINCLIRELTGTVYGGILVHIIRNSIAFYGLFILHMV